MDAELLQRLKSLDSQGHQKSLDDGGFGSLEEMTSLTPSEVDEFCQDHNFPKIRLPHYFVATIKVVDENARPTRHPSITRRPPPQL
eukprot:TRINITY_DN12896_c0_g1_i1.p1 TRINITY_DN12896_c0_g1~~TRINITY_DN12896_c0_g1_i1.p1  ORF type:complete len:86 (-),score=12.02 TRINITY_DN12896_c0_g1_i1:152-409(-)